MLRRLLDTTQEIAAASLAPVEDVAEFLDAAEQKVFEVVETKVRAGFKPLSARVHAEIAHLDAIWHREAGRITGVASGFKDLDNLTAGFQKSDLIIIAARPSMGKTALALNVAFNAAYKPQVPVAFFSPLIFAKVNLTLSLFPLVATPELMREAFFSKDLPEEQLLEYWKQLQDDSYMAYLDMVALDLPKSAKVKTPLLVLGVARDNMITPGEIEATARAYNAQSEIIADVAHNIVCSKCNGSPWQNASWFG